MRISIRSKLIIAISLLMIVLFSFAAGLFIDEKKTEMANDIYLNSLAFSKLTAPVVVKDYEMYLEQNGFLYFNRGMKSLFEQNSDIASIKVVSFGGEILYDSLKDTDQRYNGEKRLVDADLLKQIKSEFVSLKAKDGMVFYLDPTTGKYTDETGKSIAEKKSGALIDYFVVPAGEKYSIVYGISYHNLDERVAVMMQRIIYLAVFGILLGIMMSLFMSSRITKHVAKLVVGAENVAKGDLKTRVDIETHDEIGFLGESFNKMTEDLEVSLEAKLYKVRVGRELELASQIQKQIVPKSVPIVKGIDIAAGLIPAEEIGGDMYDFICDRDRFLMYLGDVTGHGVPAGLLGAVANALFYGFEEEKDLAKIIVEVNRVLKAKTMPSMFMTLCLMEWDFEASKFRFVNAGHERIIHYKAKEKAAVLEPAGGVALGMIKDISGHTKVEEVHLEPGDFLVVYSDGIPEAWKNKDEIYGMQKFVRAVERFSDSPTANAMKTALLKDVNDFRDGFKQMDDMTIVVIKKS